MTRGARFMLLGSLLFSLGAVLLTTGCGGGGNARLRVFNASPDAATLDVLLDGNSFTSNLAYASASAYQKATPGSRHLQIEQTGSSTPVIDTTLTLSADADYTVVAANLLSSISAVVLTDDNTAPASGNFKLRVIQASPSLGNVDVYVVAPGTDISTVTPNAANVAFESASGYLSLAAGSYEILIAPSGTKIPLIDSSSLSFSAGQVRTFVGLNAQGGGFTSTMLSDVN